jgi:pimeloyl-ACP methyl ester carboxylesterase
MYQVVRQSISQFIPIRHQRYHVRVWGKPQPGVPPLVLVHGWMDVSASFQFMVDAMAADRHIIAPDWRGYGLTSGPQVDSYWFPDYLADLDTLIDHYSHDSPVDLLGHSMGGHVVMMYAGVRPERIGRLINMEGFGMPSAKPEDAPARYARWMNELKAHARGDMAMKGYNSLQGVAQRLMKTNPRLSLDKAEWLASHWSAQGEDGQWCILGNAAHKIINAQLFRVEEVLATYRLITAPLLNVEAATNQMNDWYQGRYTQDEYRERLKAVHNCRTLTVPDAAHMLHHDQPAFLARELEAFLAQS